MKPMYVHSIVATYQKCAGYAGLELIFTDLKLKNLGDMIHGYFFYRNESRAESFS